LANAFDDVRAAVQAAKFQLEAADSVATNMAALLVDRLRKVNSTATLAALKRELQEFNSQTRTWKEPGHG
jgi:hypothetical protein